LKKDGDSQAMISESQSPPEKAPARRPALSADKQKLLSLRLKGEAPSAKKQDGIGRTVLAEYPLSFAQVRLWFLQNMQLESTTYNEQYLVDFTGALHPVILERSVQTLLSRHQILRMKIREDNGNLSQTIGPELPDILEMIDLSGAPPEAQAVVAANILSADQAIAFDLRSGPLLRLRLIRRGPEENRLILSFHHIVVDGWSMGIFIKEMAECYRAFLARAVPSLPSLAIQYTDYAVWQREWRKGAEGLRQLAFWKDRLHGFQELALPNDCEGDAERTGSGAFVSAFLPGEAELSAAAGRSGASLYMLCLAALYAVLHRHSNQDDLILGTVIANRNRIEVEGLMGFFVNSIGLRIRVERDESFAGLLSKVKEAMSLAQSNQDLPFELVVAGVKPKRELNRNPIFDVAFIFQNGGLPELRLPYLGIRIADNNMDKAKFDLCLVATLKDGGMELILVYRKSLFREATAAALLRHFMTVLEAGASAPSTLLGALDISHGLRQADHSGFARDFEFDIR